jgi:hypothetical protein
MVNRYVGAKHGSICIVSTSPIITDDSNVSIVEVPNEHDDVSSSELFTGFRVHGNEIRAKKRLLKPSSMKIAFVGNWKMRCGIATYNENLWPEIAKHVGDFKLFIERNDAPTSPINVIGDVAVPADKVLPCWKRGEPLSELVAAIKAYDPDIVHIQHEFGIWPHAGHWLSLMGQLNDYNTFVTMHSVFHHRDKTIVEAAMPNIIVHLEGAKNVLKNEKGVPGNVFVIPHGCNLITNKDRLWNFYHTEHTMVQWGFGFRYKNFENAIETTNVLKAKYGDVFFTALFSESPFNAIGHQTYYDELVQLTNRLKLNDNVAIIRGYQSPTSLDCYLRTNRIALFPYVGSIEHEVFGASGAAREAMTKMLPIVTTNVNHFSDLPTLKGDTPEQLASEIDKMWSNPLAYKQQVERQATYVEENSWSNVALQHLKAFSK